MKRFLPLLACMAMPPVHAQTVELETVVSGLTNPVDIAHCGDARIFIVQRGGLIKVLLPDGELLATPFLDISGSANTSGGEQGLLGMAFHPQYGANGFFYIYYCIGSGNGSVRVSRFSVSADPNVADGASESVLWELPQPHANHKGGDIEFGPDGYLYFAPGDGGDANDPGNRAQDMALGHGKLHRIDVDGASPYSIPPSNPFATADNADTLRTIFASGLRNPFRFGFDAANGDIWIADVGQGAREEVDRIAAGDLSGPNFGWRCREGAIATPGIDAGTCPSPSAFVEPVADLDHSGGWCSVIGGRVYRGTRYPALAGRYIYTDYCLGRLYSIRPNGSGGWINESLTPTGTFGFAAISEDAVGELYAVNTSNGTISRIIDASATVRLSLKLVLEGPYDTGSGLMSDALRSAGLVPTTEPYTTTLGYRPVAKGGSEATTSGVLSATGAGAVVDWVRMELRPVADPTVIAASAQGLLQRDGDVVAADGSSPITFRVGAGNYHVAVRHRNHLGVMTATGIALTATATAVDFRSSATATYGTAARTTLGGVQALWAGNTAADDRLQYVGEGNDRDPILSAVGGNVPTATVTGYRIEDVNLDGVVRYVGNSNDRDPILVNIGGSVPTQVRLEQLP